MLELEKKFFYYIHKHLYIIYIYIYIYQWLVKLLVYTRTLIYYRKGKGIVASYS
jgi:hypothetical protein